MYYHQVILWLWWKTFEHFFPGRNSLFVILFTFLTLFSTLYSLKAVDDPMMEEPLWQTADGPAAEAEADGVRRDEEVAAAGDGVGDVLQEGGEEEEEEVEEVVEMVSTDPMCHVGPAVVHLPDGEELIMNEDGWVLVKQEKEEEKEGQKEEKMEDEEEEKKEEEEEEGKAMDVDDAPPDAAGQGKDVWRRMAPGGAGGGDKFAKRQRLEERTGRAFAPLLKSLHDRLVGEMVQKCRLEDPLMVLEVCMCPVNIGHFYLVCRSRFSCSDWGLLNWII